MVAIRDSYVRADGIVPLHYSFPGKTQAIDESRWQKCWE